MRLEDLGLIGNCQFSALIHNSGEIVWCCLPRFDSEPVFSTLLDSKDDGRFGLQKRKGWLGGLLVSELWSSTPAGSRRMDSASH